MREYHARNVQFCPEFCNCSKVNTNLTVQRCTQDPADELSLLLRTNLDISVLVIFESSLSKLSSAVCNMTKLKSLNVSKNKLSNLPWACLKKLKYLQTIIASENRIRQLDNGSFYDFPALQNLELQSNEILFIDVDVFMQVERIKYLQFLDLASNLLISVDPWPIMFVQPVTTNLQRNNIRMFTNQFNFTFKIKYFKTHKTIYLAHNRITHISDLLNGWTLPPEFTYIIEGHETKQSLYLFKNPFICDCTDYHIYTALKRALRSTSISSFLCNKPKRLYKQRIISVPLDDFVCHIKEDCPVGCKCIYQPNQMNMSVNCEGRNMTGLPGKVPKLQHHNDKYQLNMEQNNITDLVFKPYFGRVKAASFSYNEMRNISLKAFLGFKQIELLYLDNNKLRYLPQNITSVNMTVVKDIRLQGNQWVCDCNAKETKHWMTEMRHVISDKNGIICNEPSHLKGVNLLSLKDDDLICGDRPNRKMNTYFGVVGTAIVLCLSFICLLVVMRYNKRWLYKRFHWHPFDMDECEGEDKEFDVFVSYENLDEEYVEEYLIPNLQQRGYKVAYHRVNFQGGQPIAVSIEQCILKSKRTLVVFSNNFKASAWCMWEFTVALELDGNKGTHRLLAIKYEDVDLKHLDLTLQAYFKRYTYIEKESQVFWDNLEYSLPLNKMGHPGDQARDIAIN